MVYKMYTFLILLASTVILNVSVSADVDTPLIPTFQQPPDEIPKWTVAPATEEPPKDEKQPEDTSIHEPVPVPEVPVIEPEVPVSEPDPSDSQLCFNGPQAPILIGLPGPAGPQGPQGVPGVPGPVGIPGSHGSNGVNGLPGYPGDSGQKGSKGDPGIPGAHGTPGYEGPIGPRGNPGYRGDEGIKGATGSPGRIGLTGPPGASGAIGPRGPVGPKGESGNQGLQGEKGDCACPTTNPVAAKRNKVSFSVARSTGLLADHGPVIIKWDNVFSNVGESFNPKTGIFNCSVSGSYFFVFHIAKSSNQNFPLVQLIRNGDHVVAAIDYGSMDSEDSTSNSVILDLQPNDLVWLQLYEDREVYSSHYRFTTFSGFLLFPN